MPSYRYLKDIKPEDVKPPEPPKEPNRREKTANWWHYHWYHVLGAVLVVAVTVYFIVDMRSGDKPDVSIGLVTEDELPSGFTELLQEQFATGIPDMNGDGQVTVSVNLFTVELSEEEAAALSQGEQSESLGQGAGNPYAQMAGVTRLSTALKEGDPAFLIVSPAHMDSYVGDELRSRNASIVALRQLPGFGRMDLRYELLGESFDGSEWLEEYYVAVVPAEGQAGPGSAQKQENWMRAEMLLEALRQA